LRKKSDIAFASLHSWDFSELQTPQLSRLLLCQKQLYAVEFDIAKINFDIKETEKQITVLCAKEAAEFPRAQVWSAKCAPRERLQAVSVDSGRLSHVYKFSRSKDDAVIKECVEYYYLDGSSAWVKLTVPLEFKDQLFPCAGVPPWIDETNKLTSSCR
jgi:hypothetical protein